jgi:hypothetical protein
MSHPEAPQPEATSEVVREESREQTREELRESPQDPSQRQFLKTLFGSAAGIAGLAIAGELTNPAPAEAAYTAGGVVPVPSDYTTHNFPLPDYSNLTTGDLVNTNLRVDGHLAVKGYRPWIDVTAYGASGLASQNQKLPIQAAFDAVPDRGGVVYFPPGIYNLETSITVPANRHVTIMGAGRGVSNLVFSAGACLNVVNTHHGYACTIHDLTFVAGAVTNLPAIRYVTNWVATSPVDGLASPHIHDVTIRGPFLKGIELTQASGAKIERFEIRGNVGGAMTHGIHLLVGSSIVNITSGYISGADIGIEQSGNFSEGIYIRGVEVVTDHATGAGRTRIGYKLSSPSPGSAISDCHASTTEHGIYIVNHGEMAFTGNLLYGTGQDTWTGIYAEGTGPGDNGLSARRLRIIGNNMTDAPWNIDGVVQSSGHRFGIYLQGAVHDCTIQGNVMTQMKHGIVFNGGGTNNNIVLGNRIRASIQAYYDADLGTTGNIYQHNIDTP